MNKRGQLNPRSNVKLDNAPKSHPPIVLIAAVSFLILLIIIGILISIRLISFEDGKLILGKSYDLTLKDAYIDGENVNVIVGRGSAKGNLTGIRFTFSKRESNISVERYVDLGEDGERIFSFTSSEIPGITGYEKVSVAPIYLSDNGERILGKVDDSKKISDTPSGGGGGGGGSSGGGSGGTSGDTGTPGTEEDFVLLSSSSGNNLETDDLTASPQNVGSYNTLIYDWRKNGNSIAVLNMPFDTNVSTNTTGAIRDYSSYANNGTLNQTFGNLPIWNASGISGGAYTFDGNGNYITIPTSAGGVLDPDNVSVEAWFLFNGDIGTSQFIFQRYSGTYGLYISNASNRVTFYVDTSDVGGSWQEARTNPGGATPGSWIHAVGTYNGTHMALYVNGNLVNSITQSGLIDNGGAYAYIGGYPIGSKYFNGTIDGVRVYNNTLSAEQILAMYNAGAPRYDKIVSKETNIGDNWTVSVTLNNETSDMKTLRSNWILITQLGTDTIAPQRSNGAPLGTLSSGTFQTNVSLTTNENAVCRYSTSPGTSYQSMSAFSNTGGTTHSFIKTGLSNGVAYNYYVRCSDNSGNSNIDDYIISFTVDVGRTGGAGLLYYDGLENGDFPSEWQVSYCCNYSTETVQSPARAGSYAARFELRRYDPIVHNGKRAEIWCCKDPYYYTSGGVGDERWYGFSIFIPDDWNLDPPILGGEILFQLHGRPDTHLGETSRNPVFTIRVVGNEWRILNVWSPLAVSNATTRIRETLWTGPLTKGVWTDWVVHAYWSYEADGILEVWKDGVKVVDKSGGNMYNDTNPMYFKIGIYNPEWADNTTVRNATFRAVYHDEVRITDGNGSYADVDPSWTLP